MSEEDSSAEDKSRWYYIKLGGKLGIVCIIGYLIWRLIIHPVRTWYRIRRWLRTERDYVIDFSWTGLPPLYFEMEVQLTQSGNPEMNIYYDIFRSPVRINADYEFNIGRLATLIGRRETDPAPTPYSEMETLKQLIETVMASTPGVHNYLDDNGDRCEFSKARSLRIEYRIYPDGLTQHALMNGMIDIVNAIMYADRILTSYQNRLEDQT